MKRAGVCWFRPMHANESRRNLRRNCQRLMGMAEVFVAMTVVAESRFFQ